jgi:hypothetical protein
MELFIARIRQKLNLFLLTKLRYLYAQCGCDMLITPNHSSSLVAEKPDKDLGCRPLGG